MSVEDLTGQLLIRLTWHQYFNNRHIDGIHLKLTAADSKLPIVADPAFLRLVSRTGNFIPTPSATQLIVNVKMSLLTLSSRINSILKFHAFKELIESSAAEAQKIGLPDWKPLRFQLTTEQLLEQRRKVFTDSNPAWRHFRGEYPRLPSLFQEFQDKAILTATAISKSIPGCKWQNLTSAERLILREFQSESRITVGKADKGMGPVIASTELYHEALRSVLYDNAGTYKELHGVTTDALLKSMEADFRSVTVRFRKIKGFNSLFYNLDKWHSACLSQPRLCPIYLLWKLLKKGVRPINPNVLYYTCQESDWLHCILAPYVFENKLVLKDSLTLIRRMETMAVSPRLRVATFDVTALYPSIDLERGLKSLSWFLETFCFRLDKDVQALVLVLARFVLTHCYITCPEISVNPFHQMIGTAMGTSFAVVYANIHLFFIETNIVNSFSESIDLYSRFLDDGITFWGGSDEDFAVFSKAFNDVDPSIKFIWTDCSKSAIVLDLSIKIQYDRIDFEVYHKPGSAFAYLPHGSFHVRRTFAAFIKTELQRALTHSSSYDRWAKRCSLFYSKLRKCGYGSYFLMSVFSKVTWGDRSKILHPSPKPARFFDPRCVWSCSNALGLRELFASCDLNLAEIDPKSVIFPAKVNKVVKSAKRLSTYMKNYNRKNGPHYRSSQAVVGFP